MVVLLDGQGYAVGVAPKATVHHTRTPLHLAFSCYVLDPDDRLLVTRRALSKPTFPGVWTNSLCGHPGPEESLVSAVARRAEQELGLVLDSIELVLPEFSYRAEMGGVVEHEMCPVFVARVQADSPLEPYPAEVQQARWMPWSDVVTAVLAGEPGWSSWSRQQVRELRALGAHPGDWPTGAADRLPPAARLR